MDEQSTSFSLKLLTCVVTWSYQLAATSKQGILQPCRRLQKLRYLALIL